MTTRRARIFAIARRALGVDVVPRALGTFERFWLPAALFVVASALALFRLPVHSLSGLWAEDGSVFITGAYQHGIADIVTPYAGYLLVFPRIVATLVIAVVPVTYIGLALSVSASLLTGAVAVSVYLFARQRLTSRVVQLILWLNIAVLPIAGGEVIDSISNSHWFLIYGAFWAAIVTPRGRALLVLQCLVVALAVLDDPLAAALVGPLVLARIITVRSWRGNVVSIVFVASAIIQAIGTYFGTVLESSRTFSHSLPTPLSFMEMYSNRVALNAVTGVHASELISTPSRGWVLVVVLIGIAATVIAIAIYDAHHRVLILLFAGSSVIFALGSWILVWDGLSSVGPWLLVIGGRYAVVPTFLLFAALCLCVDSLAIRARRPAVGIVAIGLAATLVVAVSANDYRIWNGRLGETPWAQAIARGRADCLADPSLPAPIITISPSNAFAVTIPCTVLVANSN